MTRRSGDHPAVDPPATARPLNGWRVLVPRAADRAGELVELLAAAGATPVAVPLIGLAPPEDAAALDFSLVELFRGGFAWVAFTSVSAVDAVLRRAAELDLSPVVPADTRVAAVGPATATALRSAGLPVDLMPAAGGSAAALAAIWPAPGDDDAVLLPRSDLAAPTLPDALSRLGYRVRMVIAYRTTVTPPPAQVATDLAAGSFDAVLFTSPSTVRATAGIDIAATTVLCAIGEPTAEESARSGRPVHITAADPTARGMLRALTDVAPAHRRHVEA
jgi:uroporphyrinogen-III synthase